MAKMANRIFCHKRLKQMEETAAFKRRSLNEILKIVLKEFSKGYTTGICQVVFNLLNKDQISKSETERVKDYLYENKPDENRLLRLYPYWFSNEDERIEFLKELIKKTE